MALLEKLRKWRSARKEVKRQQRQQRREASLETPKPPGPIKRATTKLRLMNAILAGLKNWKTTLAGMGISLLMLFQEGTLDFTKLATPEFWLTLLIGVLARDADKSSESSGAN